MSRPGIGQIRRGPKWGGTDKQNTVECGNKGCTTTQNHLPTSIHTTAINPHTNRVNSFRSETTRAMVYDWLLVCGWSTQGSKLVCDQCKGSKE